MTLKLYACFTPSHRPLLERHFLPSLPEPWCAISRGTPPGPAEIPSDLILRELPQHSPSGAFRSDGFQKTCCDKVDFILEALATEKEPLLFSDVDVRFYGPVVDDLLTCLGSADMAFQWDGPGAECSGFMVLRPTNAVLEFWQAVRKRMTVTGAMDQDAMHESLAGFGGALKRVVLPARYWTHGREGKRWNVGDRVAPPVDLLVHHANWTVGIENKLRLLEAVKAERERASRNSAIMEREEALADPAGNARTTGPLSGCRVSVHEVTPESQAPARRTYTIEDMLAAVEQERTKLTSWHDPMPLAIVLQFWKGDKSDAMALARLLADIEPVRRDDTGFVFARQSGCPMDEEIEKAMSYVGRRFSVIDLEAKVPAWMGYPGAAGAAWSNAGAQLAEAYLDGRLPYHSAFFIEADGCPLPPLGRWIDRIKRAHQEALDHGKLVTGPRMRERDHINGCMAIHLRAFVDIPSLQRCPAREAYDIFHGLTLVRESHPTNIIRNEFGVTLNEHWFHHLGREAAWLTSVKDGTHHHWARKTLEAAKRGRKR